MNYELINNIALGTPQWQTIKGRIKRENKQLLTLTAMPRFADILNSEQISGVNLIDHLIGRQYDQSGYRFFNDVPVPDGDQIFMNADGSISIINNGDPIGQEFLFSKTRRRAQDVRYMNPDGSLDYIHEFAFDGSTFSNILYYNNEIQELDFMDKQERVHIRFFYYNKVINLVTIENPETHVVEAKYDTLLAFITDQLAKMVTPDDTITITYLGLELDAISQTSSHNVLDMVEDPYDAQGKVRGNLLGILENRIPNVQEVLVSQRNYQRLADDGIATDKLRVVNQ